MKKFFPYVLIVFLGILAFFLKKCNEGETAIAKNNSAKIKSNNRNRGFDRTLAYLEYTEHARCRMKCRKISQEDIKDIMRDGKVNYTKSELKTSPCPVYVVQGYTRDKENLRVVFAQCDTKTKVITCYNLEQDFECECPGDEKKKYR